MTNAGVLSGLGPKERVTDDQSRTCTEKCRPRLKPWLRLAVVASAGGLLVMCVNSSFGIFLTGMVLIGAARSSRSPPAPCRAN